MKAEHINPFLRAVVNTFQTMFGAEAHRGELTLGDPRRRTHPISGIIGLSGRASGTVVINLSREVALRAASVLLLETKTDVDDDVCDAVGELANLVAGQAKTELAEFHLSVSMPSVVIGEGHEIRFPTCAPPVCVPFTTDFGPLLLEVGLEPEPALAGAR